MNDVAERLSGHKRELARRWFDLLGAQGKDVRNGALSGAARGDLEDCCSGLIAFLRSGDNGPLRRYFVQLVGGSPRFHLAGTQRELNLFRQAAWATLIETDTEPPPAEHWQALDRAAEQGVLSLAEIFQSA